MKIEVLICAFRHLLCCAISVTLAVNEISSNFNSQFQTSFNHKTYNDTFVTANFAFESISDKTKNERDLNVTCNSKPCLRLCCREAQKMSLPCVTSEELTVPSPDGSIEIDLTSGQYVLLEGKPCAVMFSLEPHEFESDQWDFTVSSV